MIVTKSEWLRFFQPFLQRKYYMLCLKKADYLIRLFNVFFTLKGRKSLTSHLCLSGGLHLIIDLMINSRSTRISFVWFNKNKNPLISLNCNISLGWWNSELPRGYRRTGPVSFPSFYHSHATSGMSFQMHVLGLLEDKLKRDFVKKF